MVKKTLLVMFCLIPLLAQHFTLAATKNPGRLERENLYAARVVAAKFARVKSSQDFLKEFGDDLSAADKKHFINGTKGYKWNPIKLDGDTIIIDQDVKFKFINVNTYKIQVNGKDFIIDPKAPTKLQIELLQRLIASNPQKNALLNLFLPEAQAIAPALAGAAMLVFHAGRWILVGAGHVARSGWKFIGPIIGGSATAVVIDQVKTGNAMNIFNLAVCHFATGCEDKNGMPIPKDVIDNPNSGYGIQHDIKKCPTTTDPNFEFTVTSYTFVQAPGQTEPRRVKVRTQYLVNTEEVKGEIQIKNYTQQTTYPGIESIPELANIPRVAPMVFLMDQGSLKSIDYVAPEFRGSENFSDYQLDRAKVEALKAGRTPDSTPTPEELRWDAAKINVAFVKERLATECGSTTRKLFDPKSPAVLDPVFGTPVSF